jgi:hypothetical protein
VPRNHNTAISRSASAEENAWDDTALGMERKLFKSGDSASVFFHTAPPARSASNEHRPLSQIIIFIPHITTLLLLSLSYFETMASSAHRILAKKFIGSVARLNQSVAVSVATETTKWNRSEEFADKIGKDIVNLIEKKPKNVPEGVTELCVR